MSDAADHPDADDTDPGILLGGRRPRVMAQSAVLDEEGSPRLFLRAVFTGSVAALALIAWTGFLTVDDAVSVPGTVVPGGEVKTVRLADAGTVEAVLVKNGDKVEEGQVLLRLAAGDLHRELNKIKVRRAGVGLLAAGLKALGSDKAPDYSFALPDHKDLVEKERVVFEGIKAISDKQRRDIESQIASLKKELEQVTKRRETLSRDTDILEEELQFREDLFKKGLTDKGVYAETKSQVAKAYNDLAKLTSDRQRINKALADAEKRLRAYDVRLRGQVTAELLVVDPVLDGLNQTYRQLNDRVSRLTVSAPAGGIVRAAKIPAVGEALQPHATILEVVPLTGETAIEARIPAADLARVEVGHAVTVRTASGGAGIAGHLTDISATPTTDDKGRTYHKATITIAGDPLKPAPGLKRLPPGTAVECTVKVGGRPLYAHLWRKIAGH